MNLEEFIQCVKKLGKKYPDHLKNEVVIMDRDETHHRYYQIKDFGGATIFSKDTGKSLDVVFIEVNKNYLEMPSIEKNGDTH